MKAYKFLAWTVSGRQGEVKHLNPSAQSTQDLLKRGFIEEYKPEAEKREKKVDKPTETKKAKKGGKKATQKSKG